MKVNKNIPVNERLIVALDVDSSDEAKKLVLELGDTVHFYKIGLQLFMAGDYFPLIDWLSSQGKKVFVDLKFFDIPETVARAVNRLKGRNVTFATVHGNDKILKAAVKSKNDVKILAVTVLTSIDDRDIKDLGFQCDVKSLVLSRAKNAVNLGCDGIVSSGLEVKDLRGNFGNGFLVVCPGIRPVQNDVSSDDQQRVVDVATAFNNGADYIVVGRPIRNAENPRSVAEEMQKTIKSIFSTHHT